MKNEIIFIKNMAICKYKIILCVVERIFFSIALDAYTYLNRNNSLIKISDNKFKNIYIL